jgi:hypothetical protein
MRTHQALNDIRSNKAATPSYKYSHDSAVILSEMQKLFPSLYGTVLL